MIVHNLLQKLLYLCFIVGSVTTVKKTPVNECIGKSLEAGFSEFSRYNYGVLVIKPKQLFTFKKQHLQKII